MSSFIDDLVAATKRHGVPCVLLGGVNGVSTVAYDEEDDDEVAEYVPPPFPGESSAPTGDGEETAQLRSQVQSLTAKVAELEAENVALRQAGSNGGGEQVPAAGDQGYRDDQGIDVLGFEDEKLYNKLLRLGYDSIGKLNKAHADGTLKNDHKFKKDWLIEVGMRLSGARPSRAAAAAPAGGGGGSAEGVPEGHDDRPWPERLSVARQKQETLDGLRAQLAEKQKEAQQYTDKGQDVPDALDEKIIGIEEDADKAEAQLVALRWCLGLDPDKTITLDEALHRANLGPWMSNPTPRVMQ